MTFRPLTYQRNGIFVALRVHHVGELESLHVTEDRIVSNLDKAGRNEAVMDMGDELSSGVSRYSGPGGNVISAWRLKQPSGALRGEKTLGLLTRLGE